MRPTTASKRLDWAATNWANESCGFDAVRRLVVEKYGAIEGGWQTLARLAEYVAREDSVAERELVITRVFDTPARLLFEAYSRREHLVKWVGPEGWPLTLCEVDFRVGGRYPFAMTGPDGKQNVPFAVATSRSSPTGRSSSTTRSRRPAPRRWS